MKFNNDFSYRGETFKYLSLTWRLGISNIDLVRIRLSSWKPKHSRENQAVYYYDCRTEEEVKAAMKDSLTKPLGDVKKLFDKMFDDFKKEKGNSHNTGETREFLNHRFLPEARKL